MPSSRGIWLAILGAAILNPLFAQEFRATISGHVVDASGGAIPNATVTAVNTGTTETNTAVTDNSGSYTIPLLKPGEYRITFTAAGFKELVRDRVTLTVGQIAGIDASLQVGDASEKIEVTGEVALLDTQSASGGGVVNTTQVTELPLNGRNPFMLGSIMPGVSFRGASIWQRPFDNGAIANWIINGGWQSNNEFLLDGAPNNAQAGSNNIAYVPIVDAVQEFSIQQNTYDAQYGKTSGGVMNTVLKSGTNDFHVTAWEFLRRTPLDANTFQNNAKGAPKAEHYLDQYGWQLSGPVIIPKYLPRDGRVRLFYLGSFENYREGTPSPLTLSYPEPEMRQGDFSKLTNAAGQKITIYDPMTANFDAKGNPIRSPFPNNQIPQSRINPVSAAVTKYMPLPNATTPGQAYSQSNLLYPNYFAQDKFYNLILKFDWNFGDKHRAFIRHASNDRTEDRNGNGVFSGPGQDGQQPFQRINDAYVIDWVSTLTPTTVLNIRASYNRFIEKGYGSGNQGFDLTSLGLPSSLVSTLPGPTFFGRWNIDGYTALGRYQDRNTTNNYAINGNITKIWHSHTIHAGVDVRRIHYLQQGTGNILNFYSNRDWTQQTWDQGNGISGDSYASFLLGLQSNRDNDNRGYSNYPLYSFFRQWYVAPFFQDDWKVSRKLTLNLGLRYDINTPPDEKWNRMNGPFDPTVQSPIVSMLSPAALQAYPQLAGLKGGITFAGVNGVSTRASDIRWGLIQPRIGFAYQWNNKLVLRGGFGMYYLNPSNDYLQTSGFSTSTPLVYSNDGGRTPVANVLSNPYPNGINFPAGASGGALTYVGQGLNWFDHNFKVPNSNQFSFGFQYAVSSASTVTVSYVGNRIYNLQTNTGYDEPGLDLRQKCNPLEGGSPSYCDELMANPFKGLAPFVGSNLYTDNQISRWQLSRPYPQYTWLTQQGTNLGHMWYNSLQVNYNLRFRGGLTLVTNYTFSKQAERWGYNDLQAKKFQQGLYYADRPHAFKFTGVYDLPFGDGKRFGSGTTGVTKKLISGWEVNTFYTLQSGEPADLPGNVRMLKDPKVSANWSDYQPRGWSNCVAQMNNSGDITFMDYSVKDCGTDLANYAWLILPKYAPRETPYRSGQIRMWGSFTMDASVNKMTQITERLKVQFRAEAFNVMNHYFAPFERFNTDPFSANFGTITPSTIGTSNTMMPRQIQLGFKILW